MKYRHSRYCNLLSRIGQAKGQPHLYSKRSDGFGASGVVSKHEGVFQRRDKVQQGVRSQQQLYWIIRSCGSNGNTRQFQAKQCNNLIVLSMGLDVIDCKVKYLEDFGVTAV